MTRVVETTEAWAVLTSDGILMLDGAAPDLYPSETMAEECARVSREVFPEARAVRVKVTVDIV